MTTTPFTLTPSPRVNCAHVDIKTRSAALYVELAQFYAIAREMRWDENGKLLTGSDLKDVDAVCDSMKESLQALEYIASGSPPIKEFPQLFAAREG